MVNRHSLSLSPQQYQKDGKRIKYAAGEDCLYYDAKNDKYNNKGCDSPVLKHSFCRYTAPGCERKIPFVILEDVNRSFCLVENDPNCQFANQHHWDPLNPLANYP